MRTREALGFAGVLALGAWLGCSSSASSASDMTGGGAAGDGPTASSSASTTSTAHGPAASSSTTSTAGAGGDAAGGGSGTGGAGQGGASDAALDDNRDRLLQTYFEYLEANATSPQSNGLSASNVSSVCDVWTKLDPSPRAVFLTITRRLQGSILGVDRSSMLAHVVTIYRIAGGQDETPTDPGSCGGGEYNRMIMSMDAELYASQLAANQHQGARQPNGRYDIADAPTKGTFWRDSHDAGGPHAPFDLSDETDQGAPRGQTQYFSDPTSALASMPLGRQDLTTLVDPYALEMDEDYDCVHNSNPSCSYTTYGQFCFPETSELGTTIFTQNYGDFEPSWKPSGCP